MANLPVSPEQLAALRALAGSEAGRNFLDSLRRNQGSALEAAVAQAQKGDYGSLRTMAADLLSTPEGKALLRKLGQNHG